MAWYYGEFNCGHEGRVNIIGPTKDRQYKADRKFRGLCEECYRLRLEEERQIANKEAEEKAKEMELPGLIGTEKQINWANTLRQELIDKFCNFIDRYLDDKKEWKEIKWLYQTELDEIDIEDVILIRDFIIENITSAKYFIDNRSERVVFHIAKNKKEALKSDKEKLEECYQKELIEREKIENTVYPENKITDVAAEIIIEETKIKVKFEKNDAFIKIVKNLDYKWNGVWERKLSKTTGSYIDRAAELANKLLSEGFPVVVPTKEIREKAVNGTFEQECTRWIYARTDGRYKGWLAIRWSERNDKLYNAARKLSGSKWDSAVMVKVEHYEIIEEFADLYGFKFTHGALELIEEYKKVIESIKSVEVKEVGKLEHKDGLKEILNSSTEILDDLIDY